MAQAASTQQDLDLAAVNADLADRDALSVIQWAGETFGDGLVMSSSFGAQSALLLHLATRVKPDIPVIFIDTGYLFPETYQFAEQLTDRLNLNLQVYRPRYSAAWLEAKFGKLWEQGETGMREYLEIAKVEPMQRALDELGVSAWLAGLRAEQTDHRASLRKVESQDGRYKVHPVLNWTTKDLHDYFKAYDLPYHPLYYQGYASIGDVHSTRPITAEQSDRDGRFGGLRQECGLHLPSSDEENESREASGL
jgi:phosphoadenosine phosphosulfate reductase